MPFSFSASMTRWNPSVSSASVSPPVWSRPVWSRPVWSSAADMAAFLFPGLFPARRSGGAPTAFFYPRLYRGVEKVAVFLDMRGKPHGVLAHQAGGAVGVARGKGCNDRPVVGDRALRTIVLRHRHGAHGAHVDEQRLGQAGHQ